LVGCHGGTCLQSQHSGDRGGSGGVQTSLGNIAKPYLIHTCMHKPFGVWYVEFELLVRHQEINSDLKVVDLRLELERKDKASVVNYQVILTEMIPMILSFRRKSTEKGVKIKSRAL
jgi:hypothetical protein